MDDWAEIRRLHAAGGHSKRELAKLLEVSRGTVDRALASDRIPRYERASTGSSFDAVAAAVRRLLVDSPRMPSPALAERVGWSGSSSLFRSHVAAIRPEYLPPDPADRIDHQPGVQVQCDLWFPHQAIPLGHGQHGMPPVLALSEFRANLVAEGNQADLATFDALTSAQRSELSDYLLGESVSFSAPPAEAVPVGDGVVAFGDFEWGVPAGGESLAARGYSIPIWGTQWFSFAGISIIQVKNSMSYTVGFNPSQGTIVTGIQAYNCQVQHNYDVFAQVTSTKANAFPDGYEAESQCLVSVKRGTPTPWGQITFTTHESIHYLRGDNTGWVTGHGWK